MKTLANYIPYLKMTISYQINLPNGFTAWKVPKYGVFSGAYFPVFALNTEIYGVNLRIQYEWRKIPTRKNCVFGHLSLSVSVAKKMNSQKKLNWNLLGIGHCFQF